MIEYQISYDISGPPDTTYDVVAIAKPAFGKRCKKDKNGKLRNRKYRAKTYSVGSGSHLITIAKKLNKPDEYLKVPVCARTGRWVNINYIVKLKHNDIIVARDKYKEIEQIYVRR